MSKILSKVLNSFSKHPNCWTCAKHGDVVSCLSSNSLQVRSLFYPSSSNTGNLAPQQVNSILRINEQSFHLGNGVVSNLDVNKLPSNDPIEDRDASGKLKYGAADQYLFGVFDGHAGPSCAQVVSERLYNYIAVTMSPPEILEKIRHDEFELDTLLNWFHGPRKDSFSREMEEVYRAKLAKLASEILALCDETTVKENLCSAFNRLDKDLSTEAIPSTLNALKFKSLKVAFSGSCACVGFIERNDLYIANVGDCQAVLGVQEKNEWNALPLSNNHDAGNPSEIRRLLNAHPNEGANLVQGGRLFGSLIPLRAFGDVRYKWSKQDLKHVSKIHDYNIHIYGDALIPKHYHTPPYVTADPEIIHYSLAPKDKFLVIASDGLWERLSPEKVVQLVGGHIEGRQVPANFIRDREINLKDLNNQLKKRKLDLSKKPIDDNVATHLIRNALGPEFDRLSYTLSLPSNRARQDRDDITVLVVHFNSHYLKDFYIEQERVMF